MLQTKKLKARGFLQGSGAAE